MKAASSRAIAVATTVGRLPFRVPVPSPRGPAESPHNSGLFINSAWSSGARITYVSRVCRRRSALFARRGGAFDGKAARQTTVTLKHIATALAGTHEMAKKQSETILGDFVGLVAKHLKK